MSEKKTIDEIIESRRVKNENLKKMRSKFSPHAGALIQLINRGALWTDLLEYLQGRLVNGDGKLELVTNAQHRSPLKKFLSTHIDRLDEMFGTTEEEKRARVINFAYATTGRKQPAKTNAEIEGDVELLSKEAVSGGGGFLPPVPKKSWAEKLDLTKGRNFK